MRMSTEKQKAVGILNSSGIFNPSRLPALIQKQISFFNLDLQNLTVLTEAASGPFVVTPIIASLAGAKRVISLTKNSPYATADEVISQTRALETLCDVTTPIEIHTQRSMNLFQDANIVTNLGFVRPIDKNVVNAMNPSGVIPLMCEAWELRNEDIDIAACRTRKIPVLGTNEDFPGLEIFTYSGNLCVKLLLEAQIEIHKSKILIVSSDKFGVVIHHRLSSMGAEVTLWNDLIPFSKQEPEKWDAVVVADYRRQELLIGNEADITAEEFSQIASGATIIQFAGRMDVDRLTQLGIKVYPGRELSSHRMVQTLAYLGPRPVIDLHSAGLKVGELALKIGQKGFDELVQEVHP